MRRMMITGLLCLAIAVSTSETAMAEKAERPGPGDPAPELQATELFDGKKVDLSSFEGKYVYIDFWATWCPPCQEPMAHLNETAPEIMRQWPDQVLLMGVSTDNKAQKPMKHCKARGWDKILQVHAKHTDAFNINGIPTAFLIGPDRKIIWCGHPAEFDLQKELQERLGGEIPEAPKSAPESATKTQEAVSRPPVMEGMAVVDDAAIIAEVNKQATLLSGNKGIPNTAALRDQLKRRQHAGLLGGSKRDAGSPSGIFDQCAKSVLAIAHVGKCGDCDEWHISWASGFVVSQSGVAATNFHVMDDADGDMFLAITRDLEVLPVTAVLAADREADCALIQLGDGTRNDFTPLPLAPQAAIGEPVTVISHPDEHFFVITRGVASRYAYDTDSGNVPWLCITAEYAKGSSGSPVFNDSGQVVGMVSSTLSIYHSETRKQQKDLQMVMRYCVPSSAIAALANPAVGNGIATPEAGSDQ